MYLIGSMGQTTSWIATGSAGTTVDVGVGATASLEESDAERKLRDIMATATSIATEMQRRNRHGTGNDDDQSHADMNDRVPTASRGPITGAEMDAFARALGESDPEEDTPVRGGVIDASDREEDPSVRGGVTKQIGSNGLAGSSRDHAVELSSDEEGAAIPATAPIGRPSERRIRVSWSKVFEKECKNVASVGNLVSAHTLARANRAMLERMKKGNALINELFGESATSDDTRLNHIVFPDTTHTFITAHNVIFNQPEPWCNQDILGLFAAHVRKRAKKQQLFVPTKWTCTDMGVDIGDDYGDAKSIALAHHSGSHFVLIHIRKYQGEVRVTMWDDLHFHGMENSIQASIEKRGTLLNRCVQLVNRRSRKTGEKIRVVVHSASKHKVQYQLDGWSCGYRVCANLLKLMFHLEVDCHLPPSELTFDTESAKDSQYYKELVARIAYWYPMIESDAEWNAIRVEPCLNRDASFRNEHMRD